MNGAMKEMTAPPKNTASDTKSRILEAARELIVKHGFNGVGISDILSKAGVPKGSFYHWFGSKEQLGVELLRAVGKVVGEEEATWLGRADMMPNHLDRLAAAMEAGLLELMKLVETDVGLMLKLGAEMSSTSEAMRVEVATFLREQDRLYTDFIGEGQKAGNIRSDLPAGDLASIMSDLWTGAYLRVLVVRNAQPMRVAIEHLKSFLAA
jgi:TetR/AcrR family transcriptional repressor of nem operon